MRVETVIVGAGHSGLALSRLLTEAGEEHVVLERADAPGQAWRERWDSFHLNTPNWTVRLPGMAYDGPDPQSFMSGTRLAARLRRYSFGLPVKCRVNVTGVEPLPGRPGLKVLTSAGPYEAMNVVIAAGSFQRPMVPDLAGWLPADVVQFDATTYKNPAQLPAGAVLVVGAAQTGAQLAEELLLAGREVVLSGGEAPRAPRRYRGRDIFDWLDAIGFLDRTKEALEYPRSRFAPNPQVSGTRGGHSLNLHALARDGVRLVGRLADFEGDTAYFAPGLHDSLRRTDASERRLLAEIDDFVATRGLVAPEDEAPRLRDGFEQPELESVNLTDEQIAAVIWALGFTYDYSFVRLPVFDSRGFPVTHRGETAYPGLYFLGLNWLHKFKSGLVLGVEEDAAYLAGRLTRQERRAAA